MSVLSVTIRTQPEGRQPASQPASQLSSAFVSSWTEACLCSPSFFFSQKRRSGDAHSRQQQQDGLSDHRP